MGEERGSLLVVTGPPGAGKSTVARLLVDRFERSVLVEGDAFFGFLAKGEIEPWLPESLHQNNVVTEAAAAATGRYVEGGYATVYEGIVGPWFLPTFAAATGIVTLDYVVLLPTVEVCVERVLTRRDHGFDDEAATRHMHLAFATATIDERHVLRDAPGDAEAVTDLVASGRERGAFSVAIAG